MTFVHVGSAASAVAARALGNNVILFPRDAPMSREETIARDCILLDSVLDSMVISCGITGASRIVALMLSEKVAESMDDVLLSDNLSKKFIGLARFFVERAPP